MCNCNLFQGSQGKLYTIVEIEAEKSAGPSEMCEECIVSYHIHFVLTISSFTLRTDVKKRVAERIGVLAFMRGSYQ